MVNKYKQEQSIKQTFKMKKLTTFIAVFLALGSIPYSGPGICILFAHIGAIGSPVLLGFWAILTGKANGMQLESTTPALDGILLRFAAFSMLILLFSIEFYCFLFRLFKMDGIFIYMQFLQNRLPQIGKIFRPYSSIRMLNWSV